MLGKYLDVTGGYDMEPTGNIGIVIMTTCVH